MLSRPCMAGITVNHQADNWTLAPVKVPGGVALLVSRKPGS
jgi:hypothetical protein